MIIMKILMIIIIIIIIIINIDNDNDGNQNNALKVEHALIPAPASLACVRVCVHVCMHARAVSTRMRDCVPEQEVAEHRLPRW